jgi:alkanesulfonate monooxygenase SsuD/methylene tetrahydromethanopterin reductase-like flavin-dependent oxidoreductase (luciferase family)
MFSVGEHHLCDYILSSPTVVLAAVAERTESIRLGTGTTLLATLDPLRVAEDYGTLDAISGGRVELVAGRGVVPRTYADLGFDFEDSRSLFEAHLGVLLEAWGSEAADLVEHRPSLRAVTVKPRPVQSPHPPVWIGGGFSKASVLLAARLGLGLMLPTILAPPFAFRELVAVYRDGFQDTGLGGPRVGVVSHVHVAMDGDNARSRFAPHQRAYFEWLGGELLPWANKGFANGPALPDSYDFDAAVDAGPVVCGSPSEVLDRIGSFHEALGIDVYLTMMDQGSPPVGQLHESMQLFAEEVARHLV